MEENFFKGVVVPMVTPFKADSSLDIPAMEALTNWLCEREVDVLFPMGGSGEYQTLKVEERKEIIRVVKETAGGRKKVVPGVGGKTLRETLTLVEEAQKVGTDGVSVVIPAAMGEYAEELSTYYGETASDFETLLNYYKKINSELSIPFMVYDSRGQLTEAQMREFVAELGWFKGIKYRSYNEGNFADAVYAAGGSVNVLSGIEYIYLGNLAMGAKGVVGGGANYFPHLMAKLKTQFEIGEVDAARETQYLLIAAAKSMDGISWPLSGKIILQKLGLPIEPVTRMEARKHPSENEARMLDFILPLCKEA